MEDTATRKNTFDFVTITVPADALAPNGTRASAVTVITKFRYCFRTGRAQGSLRPHIAEYSMHDEAQRTNDKIYRDKETNCTLGTTREY